MQNSEVSLKQEFITLEAMADVEMQWLFAENDPADFEVRQTCRKILDSGRWNDSSRLVENRATSANVR